jgi:histone H3/H4
MSSSLHVPKAIGLERHKSLTRRKKGAKHAFMQEVCFSPFVIVARALREIRYYQSEAMDGRCLLSKLGFSRVVREIAGGAVLGAEYRWESDALVALQMATEHIMIMMFELTCDTLTFKVVDCRNKLAIHAKRVTIQPKDMSLLRDLWHSIDPTSPMADPTIQRRLIERAAKIERLRQARSVPAATRLYNRLDENGARVPPVLKGFLRAHGVL